MNTIAYAQQTPEFDLYYAAYTTGRSSQGTDFHQLQRMRLSDSGVDFCDLDGGNVTFPVLTFRFLLISAATPISEASQNLLTD
jgi:hypothetical protein